MAIKGLSELLSQYKDGKIDGAKFEEELGKTLATDFITKSKFNEVNEAKKLSDKALEEANKTLEDLKKNANLNDEYKKQIEDLKTANSKAQEDFKAQLRQIKLDTAIDSALTGAKAKNNKAVRALLDTSKIVLGDDGTVSGIKEQLETIAKENDFLFESTTDDNPRFGSDTRRGGGGGGGSSLETLMYAAAGLEAPASQK